MHIAVKADCRLQRPSGLGHVERPSLPARPLGHAMSSIIALRRYGNEYGTQNRESGWSELQGVPSSVGRRSGEAWSARTISRTGKVAKGTGRDQK